MTNSHTVALDWTVQYGETQRYTDKPSICRFVADEMIDCEWTNGEQYDA
jgi:hypothetical protein